MRACILMGSLAVLSLGVSAARADELLAPIHGTVISLSIGDKQSTYYRLPSDSALDVTATGPGWLSGIVRLVLPPSFADSAAYRILVTSDADTVRQFSDTVGTADAEWIGTKEQPSMLRKFSFPISEKSRTYRFRLLNSSGYDAAVRFLLRRPAPHSKESPLYPTAMDRTLTLLYRERRLDFHLATATAPVRVHVIGPTKLRIVTRLVFGPTMKGSQKYALGLVLDKVPLRKEELSTTKAVTGEFEDEPNWLPGKSKTVYVTIPSGEHDLTISPAATDAPGVAMRFTLPSDPGNDADKD